jgi:hypothetical protein
VHSDMRVALPNKALQTDLVAEDASAQNRCANLAAPRPLNAKPLTDVASSKLDET